MRSFKQSKVEFQRVIQGDDEAFPVIATYVSAALGDRDVKFHMAEHFSKAE